MSLTAFLAKNALKVENVKFVPSKRFVDENTKKPMEWEIQAITGTEDEALQKACAKRVPVPGKKNQYQKETDYDMYLGKLAVACTVFPDLNNKELQDSYKVMGAEAVSYTHLDVYKRQAPYARHLPEQTKSLIFPLRQSDRKSVV